MGLDCNQRYTKLIVANYQVLDKSNPMPKTWDFLMELDQDRLQRLERLQAAGVDIAPILEGFRLAAQKQPIEKREEPTKRAADYLPKPKPIEYIKIWSFIGCQSWQNNQGGAWRVWSIAHHIDRQGSGKLSRCALWNYLDRLGVGERKRRRWIGQALRSGLMSYDPNNDNYYLVSLGNAAAAIGAAKVGRSSQIDIKRFVSPGWRSVVWAGVLASMGDMPISRQTIQQLTGIEERTQRNLEQQLSITYRKNYAQTELTGDHLTGMVEHGRGTAFVGLDNKIYYRLPDIRVVDSTEAKPGAKGRSKKAQKRVNLLFSEVQEKVRVLRLFHEHYKSANGATRKMGRDDIPPWEKPDEVFYIEQIGRNNNVWQPLSTRGDYAI